MHEHEPQKGLLQRRLPPLLGGVQLWLAFVTGEAWGFLGTRSLVKGAEEHAPWAQGLPLERIQHVSCHASSPVAFGRPGAPYLPL